MTHFTIVVLRNVSLTLLVVIGILLLLLWFRNSYSALVRKEEERARKSGYISGNVIAIMGLVSMPPHLAIFIVFCVPFFYFDHLSNQQNYCITLIQVNHLKKGDPFLKQRCGRLDENELIEQAKGSNLSGT